MQEVYCNRQVEFVGELLQAPFPEPTATAIRTTAVGLNQQFLLPSVMMPPDF